MITDPGKSLFSKMLFSVSKFLISVITLPAIRQDGKKAIQQNILAFWQLPCYCYGNSVMLCAVLLAIWQ